METEQPELIKETFLQRYGLADSFEMAKLEWGTLQEICLKHTSDITRLQKTADYALQRLGEVPEVHSLKVRIKHPEHLIAKIIRKKLEKGDLIIDAGNYSEHITDLIGIRALHLFKDAWRPIHDFVSATWELHEKPIAYVREGDPEAVQRSFIDRGCKVQEHPFGYRSVHSLLKSQPAKQLYLVELQVRTLFEEGWSEIDHQIRYPDLSENPYLAEFLTIFNRLAGSADEMGTFIKSLSSYVSEQEIKLSQIEKKFSKAISDLKINEKEKEQLQGQVKELRESSQRHSGLPFLTSQSLSNYDLNISNVGTVLPIASVLGMDRQCILCGKSYKGDLFSVASVCPDCQTK